MNYLIYSMLLYPAFICAMDHQDEQQGTPRKFLLVENNQSLKVSYSPEASSKLADSYEATLDFQNKLRLVNDISSNIHAQARSLLYDAMNHSEPATHPLLFDCEGQQMQQQEKVDEFHILGSSAIDDYLQKIQKDLTNKDENNNAFKQICKKRDLLAVETALLVNEWVRVMENATKLK